MWRHKTISILKLGIFIISILLLLVFEITQTYAAALPDSQKPVLPDSIIPSPLITQSKKPILQTNAILNTASTTSAVLLGGMDLNGWCASINEGQSILVNNTTWECTGNSQPIDFISQPTPNCVWQYNVPDAFAVQTVSGNPYSWACFTNSVSSNPTPTTTPSILPTPTDTPLISPTPTPTTGLIPTPTPSPVLIPTATPTITPTPAPNATDDWPTYKFNSARSSYNSGETIISASSAANLVQKLNLPCTVSPCNFKIAPPGAVISDAPAVVNNVMYYGDWTGNFYAKNVSDGSTIWTRNLGTMTPPPANLCTPQSVGVVSSPSVRSISVGGVQTQIVFIAGADGYMYALKTSDGSILWKTKIADPTKGELIWDSPSEANGSVYIGVASLGDCPLVQGRVYRLGWRFGDIQAMTKLVPDGCVGAGSWASPTYDQGSNKLYIATGTQDNSCKVNGVAYVEPYALAVVELDGSTLNIVGSYRIPASEQGPDSDFGVSPALATTTINGVSTKVVEAANKNGHAYIFKRDAISSGPIFNLTLAPGGGGTCPDCSMGTISTAATDGKTYYQGMGMCNSTKTSNCAATGYNSIMYAINPKDGSIKWQALIPKQIVSTPILLKDVLIVFEGNSVMILKTADGTLVKQITPTGPSSILNGSGAVARGILYFGDLNGNFYEYGI
jgi:outer membrane protein assembly factor BamB